MASSPVSRHSSKARTYASVSSTAFGRAPPIRIERRYQRGRAVPGFRIPCGSQASLIREWRATARSRADTRTPAANAAGVKMPRLPTSGAKRAVERYRLGNASVNQAGRSPGFAPHSVNRSTNSTLRRTPCQPRAVRPDNRRRAWGRRLRNAVLELVSIFYTISGTLDDVRFEFDPGKSTSHLTKHGIDFERAQALWADENYLEIPARTHDEPRWIVLRQIEGQVWAAIFTRRRRVIRIISVRRAREAEESLYEGT